MPVGGSSMLTGPDESGRYLAASTTSIIPKSMY